MRIQDFTEPYIDARDVCAVYAQRLRKRVAKFAAFVGVDDIAELFTEDNANRFLASLPGNPLTVRCYRGDLLTLWNAAGDDHLTAYPMMRRIRRPKCPHLVVECFTLDEVQSILRAVPGMHQSPLSNGVDRAVYWNALLRVAWDTGLRRGDCWTFRKSWIRPDGTARVTQHKTSQVVTVRVHKSTIEALDAIPYDLALDWPGKNTNSNRFCAQFKNLARRAGVTRGTFKWLRRSSGSHVELAQAGAGGKHLGHRDPAIFGKHYDGQLGGHVGPMPPDLGIVDADAYAFL